MPVDCGSMTPSSAQAATAASAAVPPARITSTATRAAAGCEVATIAFWAWTVERPAKWKFLIRKAFFSAFSLATPRVGRGLTVGSWHIHPGLGNGWYARDFTTRAGRQTQGVAADFAGFPI